MYLLSDSSLFFLLLCLLKWSKLQRLFSFTRTFLLPWHQELIVLSESHSLVLHGDGWFNQSEEVTWYWQPQISALKITKCICFSCYITKKGDFVLCVLSLALSVCWWKLHYLVMVTFKQVSTFAMAGKRDTDLYTSSKYFQQIHTSPHVTHITNDHTDNLSLVKELITTPNFKGTRKHNIS